MEKNVLIADEDFVIYGATYPKRARGLVKKGRARFLDENTICMPRPPENKEEQNMAEQDMTGQIKGSNTEGTVKKQKTQTGEKLTVMYLMEQIENIARQTEYLNQAISELRQIQVIGVGDIGNSAKAEALSDIVKCRETTNQQLLRMYEKMYDDLRPKSAALKEQALGIAERTLNNSTLGDTEKGCLIEILDTIRHIDD